MEYALREEPDAPDIIRNCGILAYQNGNLAKAAQQFRRVLDFDPQSDARFWLSVILFEDGKLREAEVLVKEQLELVAPLKASIQYREITNLQALIKIRQNDLREAKKLAESLRQENPLDPNVLVLSATISKHQGNKEEAEAMLSDALSLVNAETSLATRYHVAQEHYENGQFQAAAEILEPIVDTQIDSEPIRQLLTCHYRAGNLEPALHICRMLRDNYGPLQFVTEVEAAIYDEIDDLNAAQKTCQEYLSIFPNVLPVELRLAMINYRLKEYKELDNFLQKEFPYQELSLSGGVQLSFLLLERGYNRKALNVMYEARRQFYNIPDAHRFYVEMFLQIDLNNKDNEPFKVEKVQADTVVYITDPSQNHPRWIIIEDREDTDIQRNELPLDHPLVQRLLSKKVGENISIPQGMYEEQICIQELKSKFVHALHETMEIYPTYFSESPGIWRFSVQYSKDGTPTPETFKPLFDMIDQNQAYIDDAFETYQEEKLPIGTLAGILKMNPIEVLARLSEKTSPGVRCCSGNPGERQAAVTLSDANNRFVIDIASLITIHQLGLQRVNLTNHGKFAISRKTLEQVEQFLYNRLAIQKEHMTLGKINDQYTRTLVTEEIIQQNRAFFENLLAWADDYCEIVPCRAALTIKREARQKLGELIGPSSIETVLIAKDEYLALYSDDLVLRKLASVEFGVSGIWTQPLLISLRDEGTITHEEYAQFAVRLVCLNYHHTSIDAETLVEAARLVEWQRLYPFTRVVEGLNGKYSNPKSAVTVAVEWVKLLWNQRILPEQFENLVLATLDALAAYRNRSARTIVLNAFEERAEDKFLLIPVTARQIRELIYLWRGTHIL